MTKIRIVTDKVKAVSTKIAVLSALVKATGAVLQATGLLARTYENNTFGPEVRVICAEAGANALKNGGVLGLLTSQLLRKVMAFEKADGTFFSKIWNWVKDIFDDEDEWESSSGHIGDEEITEDGISIVEKQPNELIIALSQNDPRWAGDTMGLPDHTIGKIEGSSSYGYGCLITCIAMIGRSHGADVNPVDVNNYIKDNGGYSSYTGKDGKLVQTSNLPGGKDTQFLENRLKGKQVTRKPLKNEEVDQAINNGDPVVLHIKNFYDEGAETSDGHWVVATKLDDSGNYVCKDPATGQEKTYKKGRLHSGSNNFMYQIE